MNIVILIVSFIADFILLSVMFKIAKDTERDISDLKFDVDTLYRKDKERDGREVK